MTVKHRHFILTAFIFAMGALAAGPSTGDPAADEAGSTAKPGDFTTTVKPELYSGDGKQILEAAADAPLQTPKPHKEIQHPRIASPGLNEFDLAEFCHGAEYHSEPKADGDDKKRNKIFISRSEFGYTDLLGEHTSLAWEFVYITGRYYVQLGPYGDAGDCEYKRYLYRLDKGGFSQREEIDESRFAQIENSFRTYRQLNPGKRLGRPSDASGDSVGGCLFPIEWHKMDGQDYALFSTVPHGVGIIDYVIPYYERALSGSPSTCYAWGGRHLTNSSITWNPFEFHPINLELIFIESQKYQNGFLFKRGRDFQCIRGGDVFSYHILISRRLFDAEVRPRLGAILRKNNFSFEVIGSSDQPKVLTFLDSVRLNEEIAIFMADLAEKKGCN